MKNIKIPTITAATRTQIISESYKTGCIISQLAKSYGISVKTLYSWRSSIVPDSFNEREFRIHKVMQRQFSLPRGDSFLCRLWW